MVEITWKYVVEGTISRDEGLYSLENNSQKSFVNDTKILDKYNSKLTHAQDIAVGTSLLIIGFVAVSLNAIVLIATYRRRRQLRPPEYYIITLSVTDIGMAVFGFPFAAISSFNHRWLFGPLACTMYGFTGFFFGISSITNLALMSFVRYIKTCHAVTLGGKVNSTNVTRSIVATYAYALVWSMVPFWGWGAYDVESYGTSCTIQWANPDRSYVTTITCTCILLPIAIMMLSYANIVLERRKSGQRWKYSNRNAKRKTGGSGYLTKMAFMLCTAFLVAWMPYSIVSLWTAYGDPDQPIPIPYLLCAIPVMLAKSSTAYNPIIYFLMIKRYRTFLFKTGPQRDMSLSVSPICPCQKQRKRSPGKSFWKLLTSFKAERTSSEMCSKNSSRISNERIQYMEKKCIKPRSRKIFLKLAKNRLVWIVLVFAQSESNTEQVTMMQFPRKASKHPSKDFVHRLPRSMSYPVSIRKDNFNFNDISSPRVDSRYSRSPGRSPASNWISSTPVSPTLSSCEVLTECKSDGAKYANECF